MRLLPKTKDFFSELESHVAHIVDACAILREMTQESADVRGCAQRIKELERECDEITHKVIIDLHKTFITPLDRLGTHDIISQLDQIMDAVEQAAFRLTRRQQGKALPPEAARLVEVVASSVELVSRGVHCLKRLGTGDELLGICQEVGKLEREADEISRDVVNRLFQDVRDAATLLSWKEVYEALEEVTDRCDDVADTLENAVLDNA
jgi:predicted phosphate transport protein (TIGR00153 family)